jgi:hypothetical protein
MNGRGGFRQGAGRKGMWQNGETQTIRVPVALKEELIEIGQQLDQGQGVIAGRTFLQLEQLLAQWEVKCEEKDDEESQNIRQLISEIKTILAQRPLFRGQIRGQGNCHRQQNQNC